ncbi:MAG: hypothetical protein IT445_01735 [Phycisphaeraceae bacterium]|nr:hypothetical protein [Phycisphaeraceae bacterium]
MGRPHSSEVSPGLVSVWLNRYQNLRQLVQEHPDDASAWIWSLRLNILAYLLHRYGRQVSALDLLKSLPPNAPSNTFPSARVQQPVRAAGIETTQGTDTQLRSASGFRSTLEHICELNEMKKVFDISYPESGYKLPNEDLQRQQRELLRNEAVLLSELVPEELPLSEEQIVALLMGEKG